MTKFLNKQTVTNGLIGLSLEILFFLLAFIGVFDSLQESTAGTIFFFDFKFFLVSQVFVLLLLVMISFIRNRNEFALSNLIKYYFASTLVIALIAVFVLFTLPSPPYVMILLIIVGYLLCILLIAFLIAQIKNKLKK